MEISVKAAANTWKAALGLPDVAIHADVRANKSLEEINENLGGNMPAMWINFRRSKAVMSLSFDEVKEFSCYNKPQNGTVKYIDASVLLSNVKAEAEISKLSTAEEVLKILEQEVNR